MKDITKIKRFIEIQETLDRLSSLVDSELFPQDGWIDLSSEISQVQKTFNKKVSRWAMYWSEIAKQTRISCQKKITKVIYPDATNKTSQQ